MKSRKVMAVLETIRILIVISSINAVCTQNEFSNQDLLRLQQYNGQDESITSYNTNFIQRDTKNLANVQYHMTDDSNDGDYGRSTRGRNRKVYRIKNPFQQSHDVNASQDNNYSLDIATAASNQYPSMQYLLPPSEFLQQMRENQYQQQQQLSTPASYTATPQPSYQYSTIAGLNYDNMQQSNQISSVEPKSYSSGYQSNANYQYNQNSYNLNNQYSTPLPPYVSTPSSQYTIDTSANNYASTSLPYVSSTQTLQQYVSSPLSHISTGTYDYNNNRITTVGSNGLNYDMDTQSKRLQIDHYDNSINGIRYPLQNQYQNVYPSSTISPSSTQYPDSLRESFQNAMNGLSKSEQVYGPVQYQNYRYNNNQQDNRQQISTDNMNNDNHRIGNMPSANNIYLNYAQPDQSFNTKGRTRDSELETSPSEIYSNGDYGWKLSERKTSFGAEATTNPNNYFKYQSNSLQPETGVVTQVNFQMDTSRPYNYEQNIKPVSEKLESEEFARAAAKAHENYKQQLEASKYFTNNQYNNNALANSVSYYNHNDKQKTKLYNDNNNPFINAQSELGTTSPFYYLNRKDTGDDKAKQPFDHDKALKNIVPIDVSNVVQNSDSQVSYNKDPSDSRFTSDLYYKDKNSLYSYNLKTKPDEMTDFDKLRQFEQSSTLFRVPYHYANQNNVQPSASIPQGFQQRPQVSSDYGNILKLNDLPYRLTNGLNSDILRLHNGNYGNIPTPLPIRINQNVENHHIDVATEILNKLMGTKRNTPTINTNRPEIDSQTGNLISTINGFKVANPFNVDLKLVADMLKGKPTIDDSQMTSLRGDYSKSLPIKLDVTQLQQLLQLKNDNNAMALNAGLTSLSNPYFDIYNSAAFPYQSVKYSRSEEEPENIPIVDSSNNHPIGAVIEEPISGQDTPDLSESSEESLSGIGEDISNVPYSSNRSVGKNQKHSDSGHPDRYFFKRKYPKPDTDEPYPLLKPPPPRTSRHRGYPKDKSNNRRRINRPKILRVFKTEPLFESGSEDEIKPSTYFKYSYAQDKLDVVNEEDST